MKKHAEEDDFQLVTRRKHRHQSRNIVGTSTSVTSSKIKAAPRTAFVYVANLDCSVTTADLFDHMQDIGETAIKVERLQTKKYQTLNLE